MCDGPVTAVPIRALQKTSVVVDARIGSHHPTATRTTPIHQSMDLGATIVETPDVDHPIVEVANPEDDDEGASLQTLNQ